MCERSFWMSSGATNKAPALDPETCKLAARIAKEILANKKDLLIGVRELVPLLRVLGWSDDEDFDNIFSVEAEIDDLPLGHERAIWPRRMWAEIDLEIVNTKKLYRKPLLAEFRRLLQRLAEGT